MGWEFSVFWLKLSPIHQIKSFYFVCWLVIRVGRILYHFSKIKCSPSLFQNFLFMDTLHRLILKSNWIIPFKINLERTKLSPLWRFIDLHRLNFSSSTITFFCPRLVPPVSNPLIGLLHVYLSVEVLLIL